MKAKVIAIQCGDKIRTIKVPGDQRTITIFKLGDQKKPPSRETFEKFRDLLKRATTEPGFLIVWNGLLRVNRIKI